MCGLVGIVDQGAVGAEQRLASVVSDMADRLRHRGPDDAGHWVEGRTGVALGSRRLAIVDLSPAGHQPMLSASGRFVIAYNGELYNARELAAQLDREGRRARWRGHSDTEVIVEAIEAWGLDTALARFNGMFAFAIYDTDEHRLALVRDRLGIKPLYYSWSGGRLLFGSELKALEAHPAFQGSIDARWLDAFLHGRGTHDARTVYEDCRQLPPAGILEVDVDEPLRVPQPRTYWSPSEAARSGLATPLELSEREAEDELERLLLDSVERRLIADVPVGLLLSGGVDSSSVLALAQVATGGHVRTFTVGVEDAEFDEADDARRIAEHLGSDHHEVRAEAADLRGVIPQLAEIMDEPFSDPTIISTYLAYRLASPEVTVVLSGDGGDEVFAGYPRHRSVTALWNWLGWSPAWSRRVAARALTLPSVTRWDQLASTVRPVLPRRARQRTVGAKVHRLARWMSASTPDEMYDRIGSLWDPDTRLVASTNGLPAVEAGTSGPRGEFADLRQRILLTELEETLPRTQLAKVDRASMALSVEARVPLLDHRVVEFVLQLPPGMTYGQPEPKRLLRRVLERHVPRPLFDRPKSGFLLPLGEWLRGPLRGWASDLLDPARLEREGHLLAAPFTERWRQHLEGHADHTSHLWPALMFQLWLESKQSANLRASAAG